MPVIHPHLTSSNVQRLLFLHNLGYPSVDIVALLNTEGRTTVIGKPFTKSAVIRILRNIRENAKSRYVTAARIIGAN